MNKTRRRFRRKSPQPCLKKKHRLNQGNTQHDKENIKYYSPSPRMRKKNDYCNKNN